MYIQKNECIDLLFMIPVVAANALSAGLLPLLLPGTWYHIDDEFVIDDVLNSQPTFFVGLVYAQFVIAIESMYEVPGNGTWYHVPVMTNEVAVDALSFFM